MRDIHTGKVDFKLKYPKDDFPLPTNATLEIMYGDGTAPEKRTVTPDNMQNGHLLFSHAYAKPGKYKSMFTLTNVVSALTLKTESYLLRRINGLTVDVMLKGRDGNALDGYGRNKARFPTNRVIQFKASVAEGDVEKYIVELNGEQYKTTTNPTLKFSTTEVNFYPAQLT